MLSLGTPASRARSIAVRRRGFPSGLAPPSLAATAISRANLLNNLPRTRSTFPFLSRMLCHLEWPDIPAHPSSIHRSWRELYYGQHTRTSNLTDHTGPVACPGPFSVH